MSVHSNVQLLDVSARHPSGTHVETPSSSWIHKPEVWESLADKHYSKPQYFREQELWGRPSLYRVGRENRLEMGLNAVAESECPDNDKRLRRRRRKGW